MRIINIGLASEGSSNTQHSDTNQTGMTLTTLQSERNNHAPCSGPAEAFRAGQLDASFQEHPRTTGAPRVPAWVGEEYSGYYGAGWVFHIAEESNNRHIQTWLGNRTD